MKKIAVFHLGLALIILNSCNTIDKPAGPPPLVYDVEHSGSTFPDPVLPAFDDLPTVRPLTDPFAWSDGSGRSTDFKDWSKRRAEIKEEIEHYEIGEKPDRPENITASFDGDTLIVNVTVNDSTLVLKAGITLPEGDGPFPAIIGIGRGTGSLPPEIFTEKNVATIAYNFTQVMRHTQTRGEEPINGLYPDLTNIGAYSAWSWGVSRIIDGLELTAETLPIDLKHLGITGCSFAGKMALYAGAFDERIALTISQESGGGGAAAWRVSETLGNVEVLGSTNGAWFRENLFQFANDVPKLPFDHHELMAMVAPRALLILGNPDYEWLADESGYVSARAAHEVYRTFGIEDRFGFSIVDQHPHCRLPDSQKPEVQAFVDKFLLGDTTAVTNVTTHSFNDVNYEMWYDGWSKGTSTFPVPDSSNIVSLYYEAECGAYGADWMVYSDNDASNQGYATSREGLNSPDSVLNTAESILEIPFNVSEGGTYFIFARVNCATAQDDSFYMKLDDNDYKTANGLRTSGWDWVKISKNDLTAGEHKLTISYREDGAKIDKVVFTTYAYGPEDAGPNAENICEFEPAI